MRLCCVVFSLKRACWKVSGLPVQFNKYLISTCDFQGTVLGTEEEAKMNSISLRKTSMNPVTRLQSRMEHRNVEKVEHRKTWWSSKYFNFSWLRFSLPTPHPHPFCLKELFWIPFHLCQVACLHRIPNHVKSPLFSILPFLTFSMSSSATSTVFGMVSFMWVVKRRKVIFVLIMRTVLCGGKVGREERQIRV